MFDLFLERGGVSILELILNKLVPQESLWEHKLYDTWTKHLGYSTRRYL